MPTPEPIDLAALRVLAATLALPRNPSLPTNPSFEHAAPLVAAAADEIENLGRALDDSHGAWVAMEKIAAERFQKIEELRQDLHDSVRDLDDARDEAAWLRLEIEELRATADIAMPVVMLMFPVFVVAVYLAVGWVMGR